MTGGMIFIVGLVLFVIAQVTLRGMAAGHAIKGSDPTTPGTMSVVKLIGVVNLIGWVLMIIGAIRYLGKR